MGRRTYSQFRAQEALRITGLVYLNTYGGPTMDQCLADANPAPIDIIPTDEDTKHQAMMAAMGEAHRFRRLPLLLLARSLTPLPPPVSSGSSFPGA